MKKEVALQGEAIKQIYCLLCSLTVTAKLSVYFEKQPINFFHYL